MSSPAAAQKRHPVAKPKAPAVKPVDDQALKTQVMLDRAGYSPGEIDATMGTSTQRALAALTKNGGNGAADATAPLVAYAITEQDATGPFTPGIPEDMLAKAKLESLGYQNLLEMLGERFHVSPALLKRLNPNARFAAGESIQVPNVAGAAWPTAGAGTVVTVRKSTSDLTVTDGSGKVLMYAPVTTGSEHDPLPIGDWKVTGVQKDPKFYYNADLFWDADVKHAKATVPSGPNNPVGVVWIDLTKEHYGIHGTPEPSKIGKTESHGCVRLTNWDAQKLASIVKPGTRVVFSE
jgi:lipoprotein-anchoring transpeptidase ErfK/SrfK